jgi:dephospho-CoA kinase
MLRVGLTGGIACGKTYVRQRLEAQGIATLDLDQLSRAVVRPGSGGHREVVEAFGSSVLAADGSIDRRGLAAVIFADTAARKRLNGIVHPLVRDEERRELRRLADAGARVAVVDAALLIEAGCHLRFERLIVAHCAAALQLERLQRRDGLGRDEAAARVAAQLAVAQKLPFASFTIDTNGSKERTEEQVAEIGLRLDSLAAARAPAALLPNERVVAALTAIRDERLAGVGPLELLQHIERQRGVDLCQLAKQQRPSWDGNWYDAVARRAVKEGPELLTLPLVLWLLATRGLDRERAVAAAAAAARLTHDRPEEIAEACLLADAVCEVAVEGELSRDWRERLSAWREEVRKWGEAAVPDRTSGTLDAVSHGCARPTAATGARDATPSDRVGEALLRIAGRLSAEPADPGLAEVWCRVVDKAVSEGW